MSCNYSPNKDKTYTKSEIDLLHLEETKQISSSSQKFETIDLNKYLENENFDFTSLVKKIHITPLETKRESLIANIYKVIVEERNIYIYDDYLGGGIIIFKRDGEFVKRLPNGSGPGELYKATDMTFDRNNDQLLVYQHPYILHYTSSGDYISQNKIPFGFYNFEVIGNNLLFKTLDSKGNQHLNEFKNCTFFITNHDFKINFAGLKSQDYKANYGGVRYLYKNNDNIQIVENGNDTIYYYNDSTKEIKAAYVLNYENKKLPNEYWNLSGRNFIDALSKNDFFFFIGEYFETQTHHAVFLRNNYLRKTYVYYRDKNSGGIKGGSNAHIDIEQIPPVAFPKCVYNNEFVSIYYPNSNTTKLSSSQLLSENNKTLLQSMTEDDNPVLVFYELRDFNDNSQ